MKKLSLKKPIILLIIAVIFSAGSVYAWVNYALALPPGSITVGDIDYTVSGDFVSSTDPIYPGQELINSPIIITNNSTIDTQMRLIITYTKIEDTVVLNNHIYTNDITDHLVVNFTSAFLYGADSYWYYPDQTTILPVGQLSIIDSVSYDGDVVSNNYADTPISISIVIQVKQADNVTWAELTSYDFSTGYPEG
ncbi:MAG: hypothetical protein K9L64_05400 [Candidatus Izimaplasma sp.]|nr:hypothetical protein [Candidatus Izimaplasma bacterium]